MDGVVKDTKNSSAREYNETLDEALTVSPAVSKKQLADLDELRLEIVRLCEQGEKAAARRCLRLALDIIRSGGPAKE